jgi:multidrug efflux pump subunit AcrA (membrane-fusion protein)
MKSIIVSRHVMVAGAVTALLISAAVTGCSTPRADAAPPLDNARGGLDRVERPAGATAPIAVSVARVAMTDLATTIDSGGVVQARTTATITARILAPVREVRVSPGDRVRAGQTLIVLDGADLAAGARAARAAALASERGSEAAVAELRAAEAGLALARASHDRVAVLQTRRSATEQELDDAIASLRSAEARVAGASARVSQAASAVESARAASDQAAATAAFATIAAPLDGLVSAKMIEPGNMASPGMPLLRLEDTREFRLEVRVDESRIGQVRNGDSVPVFLGTGTTSFAGKVVEVSRAVDADARAFLVKIALPDAPGLRSGEFGKARFTGPPRRALTVPPSAILRRGQLTSVFVVDQDVAVLRLVNVDESEVLAGLTESELVVLSPPPGVADGRRVSVGGR